MGSLYAQAIQENLSMQYLTFQALDYEQTCIHSAEEEDLDYEVFNGFVCSLTEKFIDKHQITLRKLAMRKSYVENEVCVTLRKFL